MQKIILFFALFIAVTSCHHSKPASKYISNEGYIFGTVYHITYESPEGKDFQQDVDNELHALDMSLSTFKKESILSKVNNNEPVKVDGFFTTVFKKSMEVSQKTDGAFDVTVAPLVNAWGFGFKAKQSVTPHLIDSLRSFVGYRKMRLVDSTIVKDDQRTMLDFSAIAKGYAVDVVGNLLHRMGCQNYMVEIGGEVVARGVNHEGVLWRIGINEPNDDEPLVPKHLQAIISLDNKAVATSGNYRNFYIENGKKYAHTIDPSTGYPVNHNLLSATVIANNCMTADAYATACMVMGVKKALAMASKNDEIEIFLIYADNEGENNVAYSSGFEKLLLKE